jgi:hypothetical protein
MRFGLTTRQRVFIVLALFSVAIFGFMLKLPSGFRQIDKELHTAFYFLAAAFLNILFARTSLLRHAVIFVGLYLFGMAIEWAQAYSNRFFRTRIHGRFDPEDVQSNLYGLLAFSALWIAVVSVMLLSKKSNPTNHLNSNIPKSR